MICWLNWKLSKNIYGIRFKLQVQIVKLTLKPGIIFDKLEMQILKVSEKSYFI